MLVLIHAWIKLNIDNNIKLLLHAIAALSIHLQARVCTLHISTSTYRATAESTGEEENEHFKILNAIKNEVDSPRHSIARRAYRIKQNENKYAARMVCSALVFVYCRNESVGVKRKFTWIRFAITKYHVVTHTQHIPLNKKKRCRKKRKNPEWQKSIPM